MKTSLFTTLSLILIFVFSSGIARAQGVKNIDIRYVNENNSAIQFITVSQTKDQPAVEKGMAWLNRALNLSDEYGWILLSEEKDKIGHTHFRLQQSYRDIPVEETMYILHSKNGLIYSANGEYVPELQTSVTPALNEQRALENALIEVNATLYKWQMTSAEEHLKWETGNPNATHYPKGALVIVRDPSTGAYRLGFRFDIYAHQPLSREFVFVDAENGNILYKKSRIFHVDAPATGISRYSGTVQFVCDDTGTQFRLRESGRGGGIETYNMQNNTDYASAIDFTHPDTVWDSMPNNDTLAIDAHYGAEATFDYMLNVQGRNSIDGSGFQLLNYVHYDNNFANAFWDGNRMTYGDGDATIGPLVSPDICGHEIGHGLQQFTAGFGQQGEVGALAESFSDILGMLVEDFLFPSRTNAELYNTGDQPADNVDGIRNFIDPNVTGNPDTYQGTNWDANGFNIHGNGVVQDHWFYLLAEGGTGTNDNGDSYAVNGIGRDNAGDIAFRNLVVYMTPNATFADARRFAIQSASDLFGPCSNELIATTNAWFAVGVGPEYSTVLGADFDFTVDICADPIQVDFTNTSTAAVNYVWDFGDGTTSTDQDPSHQYASNGTYSVKLVATGCDGTSQDSIIKADVIDIDNDLDCDSLNIPQTGTATANNCHGWVYDAGGRNSDALANSNGSLTIAPANAQNISITFRQFNYNFVGTVNVYDGPDNQSPLLVSFGGFTPASLDSTINSTGPELTITESVTNPPFPGFPIGSGFAAFWECTVQNITGIQEGAEAEWLIYPNPGNGRMTLKHSNLANYHRLRLFNSMGTLILDKTMQLTNGQDQMVMDISDQAAGIYYMEVSGPGDRIIKKIILNKN